MTGNWYAQTGVHVLGVDPGTTSGALVLLAPDGRTVPWWLGYWRTDSGAIKVVGSTHSGVVSNLLRIGEITRAEVDAITGHALSWHLCVEALFVGVKASSESILTLGQSCGELVGATAHPDTVRLPRPRAREDWRPVVLGLSPRADADGAEAHAVRIVSTTDLFDFGDHPFPIGAPKDVRGAIAEAACIARWGWTGAPLATVGRPKKPRPSKPKPTSPSRWCRDGDPVTIPVFPKKPRSGT